MALVNYLRFSHQLLLLYLTYLSFRAVETTLLIADQLIVHEILYRRSAQQSIIIEIPQRNGVIRCDCNNRDGRIFHRSLLSVPDVALRVFRTQN
jgi:hypothetical protein